MEASRPIVEIRQKVYSSALYKFEVSEKFVRKSSVANSLVIFVLLLAAPKPALASEPGCLGDDYQYTIERSKADSLTFQFSIECVLRNADPYIVSWKYPIEVYWPGFVSHRQALADKNTSYVRSYLSLHYDPFPKRTIKSRLNKTVSGEGFEDYGAEGDLQRFRKVTPSKNSNESYIIHPNRTDFFVICSDLHCNLHGGAGQIRYELEVYTENHMDWTLLHETTAKFISRSLVKNP